MKNILDDIRAIEYDKNHRKLFGIKSAIVWGFSKHTNSCSPLLYISKPKHISQKDYEFLLDKLIIDMQK